VSRCLIEARNTNTFVARSLAGHQRHITPRHVQQFRKHSDQLVIRCALNRRRVQTNEPRIAAHPGNRRFPRSWNHTNIQNRFRH